MGMRIVGAYIHLQRLYYRASAPSFVDMYMLKKINRYNVKPCFPLMTLRDDPPIIFTEEVVKKKLRTVRKYLKEWHGLEFSDKDVRNLVKKCENYPNDFPFNQQIVFDQNTETFEANQRAGLRGLIDKYFDKHSTPLLIGQLDHQKRYEQYRKKHPDQHDNDNGRKWDIIGVNEISKNEKVYKNIIIPDMNSHFDHKEDLADCVKFHTDTESVIIVTFLDIAMIKDMMKDEKMFQIKNKDGILWFGIYGYDKDNVVVYMKDSEDYGSGLKERIIGHESINPIFGSMGYQIIGSDSLSSLTHDEKMKDMEKSIAQIFRYAVFKKK
jgi:hypothetical protein